MCLLGCQLTTDASDVLASYVKDLNRYEGLSISAPAKRFPEYGLPSYRMKQQVLATFDLGLIDFLSLQHCELALLVGNKNSVLGRVMPNSQRFLYEVRVIKALNECEIESATLRSKLQFAAGIKREELNKAYANALFNSKETDVFYSFSNGYLPFSESESGFHELRASLSLLAQLGKMIDKGLSANEIALSGVLSDFEQHFKVTHDSEYAGRLLMSLLLLTDYLNAISGSLSLLVADDDFCRGPMVFLRQKFKVHYVEKLQPYMARVNQSAYDVLASMTKIRLASAEPSQALGQFLQQFSMGDDKAIWRPYQQSVKVHAYEWNRLLRACHLF